MARKNEVTLTFAGDSDQLEKSFDRVGSAADEMSGEVDQASRDTSKSFDRATEATDAVDTKAMGFRDTMTGVGDSMKGVGDIAKGNLFEGFMTLGMGVGDLASGFTNFLIPGIKNATKAGLANAAATVKQTVATGKHKVATVASTAATKAQTVATKALNLAMRANPLGLIITLIAGLAAAFVAAYKKSETFRNIVDGAMSAARDAIGFVVDKGQVLWEFFRDLPGKLSGKFSGMWDGIKEAFRGAINFIIDGWNGLSLELPSVDTVFGTIGGWTLNTPNIPRLHSGGVFNAPAGQSEGLALLRDQERVSTPEQDRRGRDEPINVTVKLSKEAIAGIAKVEIKKGNRTLKQAVLAESGEAR